MSGLFVDPLTRQQHDAAVDWIIALRSGKYKQGKEYLRKDESYCCLGVAADLQGAEWKAEALRDWYTCAGALDAGQFLPREYADVLGLDKRGGIYIKEGEEFSSLTGLNDNGSSFLEIADVIEQELALVGVKDA